MMRLHQLKSLWYLALPLCWCTPYATAEIYEAAALQPQKVGPGLALAAFYTVDRSGESVPEDPVASGFALSSSGSFARSHQATDETATDQEKHATRARSGDKETRTPPVSIRIEVVSRRQPSSFRRQREEFKCERPGLFYTSDDRCVVPATSRVTRIRPHPQGAIVESFSLQSTLPINFLSPRNKHRR